VLREELNVGLSMVQNAQKSKISNFFNVKT